MADPDLVASWARTTQHLAVAREALGDLAEQPAALFAEFLEHNELGLAFEVLVEAADEQSATTACWEALEHAGREMRLEEAGAYHGAAMTTVLRHRQVGE